jgi:hypothetical protein
MRPSFGDMSAAGEAIPQKGNVAKVAKMTEVFIFSVQHVLL